MFSFSYLWQKLFAVLFRYLMRRELVVNPNDVLQIQSRDAERTIKAHLYRSTSAPTPAPVLLNFHGSGFILPQHGSDEEFCQKVSRETPYTVLDIQYRLAPENPFPAALNDVEDAVNWVLERPSDFDLSRVAISGFSAGGNLALGASSTLFARETFRSVLAFYPVLDLHTEPAKKTFPDPEGKPIPPLVARIFNSCYIPSSVDARDPRISPYYAQAERFPDNILVVTAGGDSLAGEAEELAAKIEQEPGRHVVCQRMRGCNHGWDKRAAAGTVQGDAKEKAYEMAISMLAR
ncbi:esterase/lipase [Aspergillus steynii IBT 23096]|uniref:Esterase/lipase n=1 Tax=Aspergillus steynii IBT 23096 TaxID=1392250 RepID=A0A2I2GI36_9EURO|nr:esterase/lipase [Aspergillus steynii IBT 23096]PLB52540.1 esterase/lipase [Aspergillus steynii IBT 23096]